MLANLDRLGYASMTPIQAQSLPLVLAGRDLIGQASTGSGKTAAFGIGALHCLNPTLSSPQTLVLCPTRELAEQVAQGRMLLLDVREVAEDLSRCRDAHARHYERLAEEVAACLFGPKQHECLDHVEDEAADITAAIGWCIEQNDPDRAGRIAVGVRADFALVDAPSWLHIPYRVGVPVVRALEV